MVEVLEELKARPYVLDSSFEYAEIEIFGVRKQFMLDAAKGLKEGTLTEDSIQVKNMRAFVNYIESLKESGFECYEIAFFEQLKEIRRFRRKKA